MVKKRKNCKNYPRKLVLLKYFNEKFVFEGLKEVIVPEPTSKKLLFSFQTVRGTG